VCLLAIVFLGSVSGFSQDQQKEIDNSLGQAYTYLSEKNFEKAKEMFIVAGGLAVSADDWEPLLEAAQGLIVCKEFAKAKEFLHSASDMLEKSTDAHAYLALAYGMLGLPPDRRESLFPAIPLDRAYALGIQTQDWYVMSEVAKLNFALKDKSKALDALYYALTVAKSNQDPEACMTIASIYEKYHYPDKAEECRQLARLYRTEQKTALPPPPPGWSPVGESVAGPPAIDVEAGKAIRASADQQISDKREWALEQKRLDAQRQQTFYTYSYFYTYPYDYPYDGYYIYEYDDDDLRSWCDFRRSRYHYVDGWYIRIGD
jgi:hypothetical protein